MNISVQKMKEMYQEEDGKLILNLEKTRYDEYIRIINETEEYKKIIDSIPESFSNLEKAYYVYTKLGKILFENNSLVYHHLDNLWMYYDVIRENGIGNCRQMSELFVSMLTYKNIIDKFYLIRKPVPVEEVELRHIDAVIVINGKNYLTNIIRDTVNLRAGLRTVGFRFSGFEGEENRRIKKCLI